MDDIQNIQAVHLRNLRGAFNRLKQSVERVTRIQLGDDNRVELVRQDATALAQAGELVRQLS